ncbi:hypothetical protein PRZ61_10570 [Halomonas pacifica]|uniref:hypothetical protein n=1 Tax=Bisbaumannia pacifica TaxID=77098 RepID=UPI00235A0170|nr:hypothetical protein [Halomonas pacifica]MDC8803878.1 hypothetical protein [Halomonas pacifica]
MIDGLLSTITGRQHHFKVVVRYTPDGRRGEYYAERITTVWMQERKSITDERQIRKMVGASLVENVPRYLRNNGNIEIRGAYYLGWFRPRP